MNEHVTAWIAAYYDGELRGARLSEVESHLQVCAVCRAELEKLQGLSALLQENPAMPARTAPDRFVAQVRLRLSPMGGRALGGGWLLLPVFLLGIWAFLKAALVVAGLALRLAILSGQLWNPGVGAVELLALDMGLTVGLAFLVWGWLAGWWAARRKTLASAKEVIG